jgi:hypothetical protein
MIRAKLGLLVLCVSVLGMTTVSASAARAEVGSKWLILTSGGVVKTGTELPAPLAGEVENKDVSILTKILGFSTRYLCTGMTFSGTKLEQEGSLTKGGKIIFTGCKGFISNKEETSCAPHSPGAAVGTIETNKLKFLLVLIGGAKRVRVESEVEGGAFVTIESGGEECVLPKIPIFGKLYFKDCKGDTALSEHLEVHLWEEDTVNSRIWVINDTAEHLETSIDGSFLIFLTGADKGLRWGGDV